MPVLSFHSVSWNEFDSKIKYLKDSGYQSIFVNDFFKLCRSNPVLSQKTVIITSDDGYISDYDVFYPVLKKYGMKGTVNIQTSTLNNTSRHINNQQLKEMANSGLIEVGSHSHDLHGRHILRQSGETENQHKERLKKDFNQSKQILENVTQKKINIFALPEGLFSWDIIRAAQSVGLEMFLGSQRGINPINFCEGTTVLKRIESDSVGINDFKKMVDNNFQ